VGGGRVYIDRRKGDSRPHVLGCAEIGESNDVMLSVVVN
jgi:hypothetical protein